jgi:hypothetical protein
MRNNFYFRLLLAIGLKIVAVSYLIGVFWLLFALMRFVGVPWYFCIVIAGVTLVCEFDWKNNLLLGFLRSPLPKRID